jgi:hypothetical protein
VTDIANDNRQKSCLWQEAKTAIEIAGAWQAGFKRTLLQLGEAMHFIFSIS